MADAVHEEALSSVKVHVTFPDDGEHPIAGEWLWASEAEIGAPFYKIQNIPFFARGISLYDVVQAHETPGGLEVFMVAEPYGFTNVRVVNEGMTDDDKSFLGETARHFEGHWELAMPEFGVAAIPEENVEAFVRKVRKTMPNAQVEAEQA